MALETLGWSSFQDLAVAYAEDLLDVPFVVFAKTSDGGSDGQQTVFAPGMAEAPRLLVQAKHSSTLKSLTLSEFEADAAKMPALAREGFEGYLLVTNQTVTRGTEVELRKLADAAGFKRFEVHGRDQVVRRIRSSARLRALAPRLYGVGDLSQILDDRRIEQAKVRLAAAQADIDRFVATDAYRASVRALETGGVVVLLGAPAAGKSTIAKALTIAAIDAFNATPIILERLSQIPDNWNPHDPARLFWIDDVFGPTQVDPGAADAFNRLGDTMAVALEQGNRFVFTSRTHIWRSVRDNLKRAAAPGFEAGIVEIKVEDYSARDREQIVYNHLKLGDQSPGWRSLFKGLASQVANHPMFTPEVARRLGLQAFTANLQPLPYAVDAFVRNPAAYLEEVIASLSPSGRAGLALIHISGGAAPVSDLQSPALSLATQAYEVTPGQVLRELEALEGAFCVRTVIDGEPHWTYRHPTIGEAVATLAANSPALLDIYLAGTPIQRILEEAVCAGVEVKGAIIAFGVSRFDALIARIHEAGGAVSRRLLRWFLIVKATPEFRRRYFSVPMTKAHRLAERYDGKAQVIALLAVLKPEGLVDPDYLREMQRIVFDGIALYGDDDCIGLSAQALLGEDTFNEAVEVALANLADGGSSFIGYYTPTREDREQVTPSEAFAGLRTFLELLDGHGEEDVYATAAAVIEERIDEAIAEMEREIEDERWRDEEEEYYWRSQNPGAASGGGGSRSPAHSSLFHDRGSSPTHGIFSDVDQ